MNPEGKKQTSHIVAVVVTYNRCTLLQRCIEGLRNNPVHGIVVINNGSTDGTHEWLDLQKDLHVVHQENVGGAGGFYTGIQEAMRLKAAWIWCMDDDVSPRPNCIQELMSHADDYPAVGILAPRRMMNGEVYSNDFTNYNLKNPFSSLYIHRHCTRESVQPQIIAGTAFEGLCVKREVVEQIGLPNRDLFIFCDDTDYCLRAFHAGFSILYVPTAIMDKEYFFSNDTWSERNRKKKWKRYYQIRNSAYLNHHYGHNWGVRYLRSAINLSGYLFTAFFTAPFSRGYSFKDIPAFMQAWHDGVQERLDRRQESLCDKPLVMTLLVKNEEDLLEQNLCFHHAMGVDAFIVTDNNSTDRTVEIIEKYKKEGWIKAVIHEPGTNYRQKKWVNRMIRIAKRQLSAEWIINADADELWFSPSGNLKNELRQCGGNIAHCQIRSMYPESGIPFHQWEKRVEFVTDQQEYELSPYSIFQYQRGKVAHRAKGFIGIGMGNHKVHMWMPRKTEANIRIYHYNIKDREAFISKMANGGQQIEKDPNLKHASHWRYFYQIYKDGRLSEEYDRVIGKHAYDRLVADGYIIEDTTIRDFFHNKLTDEKA